MRYSAVIGLQFGDEAKGSFVNHLCSQSKSPLVVRFNGGHQAGHNVIHNGIRHTFSTFGSGTLQNVPTFWSKFCTFYPTAVFNEYQVLKSIGIDNPILYVDPLCPITTPFDCIANQEKESTNKHGSVGVGFGATIKRHESYYKLYFQDIFNSTILEAKLNNIYNYYINIEKIVMPLDIDKKISTWLLCIDELIKDGVISKSKMGMPFYINDAPYVDHIIFEGAQGVLLDMDFGFFPNVTRSNTTCKNIIKLLDDWGVSPEDCWLTTNIYYITRSYQTRHGYGFMSNEDIKPNLVNTENEANVDGGFQGKFRKSILDIDLILYALQCDNHFTSFQKQIVVSCLDQLENDTIKYTYNKEIFEKKSHNFIQHLNKLTKLNIISGVSEGQFHQTTKISA